MSKLMPPLANEGELEKVAVGDALLFQLSRESDDKVIWKVRHGGHLDRHDSW